METVWLLNKIETQQLLQISFPILYLPRPLLGHILMRVAPWVEWTCSLLCALILKISKSTRIIQEAMASCQGSRPRSPSCLINYTLRLNSLLSAYFSCLKLPQTINHLSVLPIMYGLITSHIIIIINEQNSGGKIWTMKCTFFLNISATLYD